MLFPAALWDGLAGGTVTVAFRRWRRPSVKAGGTLVSPVGVLAIDELTAIAEDDVSDADARAAGLADRAAVLAALPPDEPGLTLYRVRFKQRVRRLKALGLTESLEVGYRLSPRGGAVLERLG